MGSLIAIGDDDGDLNDQQATLVDFVVTRVAVPETE
jgi:hypothetical protein